MAPFVDGLRERGIDAAALDLPRRRAEDAVPSLQSIVPNEASVAVGGHSYGGRVASLAAAAGGARYAALVCFSYPLHPPGRPEATERRIAHWPLIACPTLLLSGDRDRFARIGLLRAAVLQLPAGALVEFPGLGHGLRPVLDEALDAVVEFLRSLG